MEWEGSSNSTLVHEHALHRSPLFSTRVTSTTIFVLNNIIGIPLTSVGILTNIFNIVVFTRQGFKESINISFISLTISDLAYLVHALWQSLSLVTLFRSVTWPFHFSEISIVVGSIPKNYYRRVSSLLTMYMAIERCVSVTKPLKVKFIFTRKHLIISVVGIYIANILPFILAIFTTRMKWKFDIFLNRSYLGIDFIEENQHLDDIGLSIGIFLQFFTFITISACAIVLVWTLHKQSKWRGKLSQSTEQNQKPIQRLADKKRKDQTEGKSSQHGPDSKQADKKDGPVLSERDKRAVKTVTLLASMFVVCYMQGILFQIAILALPEFSRGGRYRNAYLIFGTVTGRAEVVCASANILVYFRTSTKFKETMLSILCPLRRGGLVSSTQTHTSKSTLK